MKKILFFNVAWMDRYQGISNDKMHGGGKHIEKYGWGGEMFNFESQGRKMYGYVQVGGKINIERLGAKRTDDRIKDVLIVWVAKRPNPGGNYIVGWYKNATVYRAPQFKDNVQRNWNNQDLGFYVVANRNEAKLLSKDQRTVRIPRGKGAMGQSNIWYADNNPELVRKVFKYVESGEFEVDKSDEKGRAYQNDPQKRIEVERRAVDIVVEHYEKLGYEVNSVERDNVGWDLNATNGDIHLKLEVKGLSGGEIATELTPNEYFHLKNEKGNYRLCIVFNALTAPNLMIFSYFIEANQWTDEQGHILKFEERMSARLSCSFGQNN